MEVARRTALFEGSFPPLRELRRELAPIAELSMKAELLGGSLVVSGKVDLVLGRPDRTQPMRAQRLLIDLKTGGAYPEHAEDNRAYALLHTLRFGVPPYRVASFFLEGGTWQAEDVHEELLFHAADRVIAAARVGGVASRPGASRRSRPAVGAPGARGSTCARARIRGRSARPSRIDRILAAAPRRLLGFPFPFRLGRSEKGENHGQRRLRHR